MLNRTIPFAIVAALTAGQGLAQTALQDLPVIGKPHQGGMGFQPAATELARDLQWLDGFITVIITGIVLLVMALLLYVILKFNEKANPKPAGFTHNSPLEVTWTVVPIIILIFIGSFSLPILFKQQEIPEADITIKATGYQWFWGYEYVDDGFAFDSYMIGQPATGGNYVLTDEVAAQLEEAGYSRDEFLLAVDQPMVVPVGKTIVVQVTGADVIHSWAMPAFGVKQDAVPGRLAELWFEVDREGVYFGQCSELCGKDHAYMPITVKAVTEEVYAQWLEESKALFAGQPAMIDVAQAD